MEGKTRKPKKEVLGIHINSKYCTGCAICAKYCRKGVLELSKELDSKGVHIIEAVKPDECNACMLCELFCPDFAIAIETKE